MVYWNLSHLQSGHTHVCCCSVAKSCLTDCDLMNCSMPDPLSSTVSQSVLKFMSTELVMLLNHLILCCPFLLLPSIFPNTRVFFQWVGSSHQVAKVLEFSFGISPSCDYSWLISFRVDWFDFFAVQGTLKSLLQHHYLALKHIMDSSTLAQRRSACHLLGMGENVQWIWGLNVQECFGLSSAGQRVC